MHLIHRVFEPPQSSFFLFGPRGTGKSTLAQGCFADALWVDLLRPEILRRYLAWPERLFELIAGNPAKKMVVVDEVQKAPGLLTVIHSLIESKQDLQFVLTGSSPRKLKQTGADLLAGRALRRTLHPFIAAELGRTFSLETALNQGLLPLLQESQDPSDTLNAYISLYLHEEIQAERLVRNLESFARFLEVITFSHGSLLNITNVARECDVKRKTVESYINILEDLLLVFQLTPFAKRAQRAIVSHPKFYLFDPGVFRTLRPKGPLDRVEEIEGAALEGLVAQHLRAWNDYSRNKHNLHFWRTRSGLEVDFIIYGSQGFWAIEVKNSKKVYPNDLKGLLAFQEDYPEANALLLYRGSEYLKQNNILCVPCSDFLVQLKPDRGVWEK